MTRKQNSIFLISISLILIFLQITTSLAEGPKKVAILPFNMNADRDLTFLQEGIMDMLSSRLAFKDEVVIIEKGKVKKMVRKLGPAVNKEKAVEMGRALGADYVILGSLTVFGDSVSMDAVILDVAKSEELVTAFDESKGMDAVIPTINQFAQDINNKIMGRAYRAPVHVMKQDRREEAGPLVSMKGESKGPAKAGHVQRFKLGIIGMDVGDVDGDGQNELVFIDHNTVYIYKWTGDTFVNFKTIKGSWSPEYIYVSVADLDGNGVAEIYVSNLSAANVSSLVLEWDGSRFKRISHGQYWLFRVVDLPTKGKVLIGQKRVTDGTYTGDICLLKQAGDGYESTEHLKLPRYANVFNFAVTDLNAKGKQDTILLDEYDRLRVYNNNEERIWRSDEYFGGTLAFMLDKRHEVYVDEGAQGKRVFIPSPIYFTDINDDGNKELVICQNKSATNRITESMRWFTSGKVHFMTWDGVDLSTQWTSQKLPGAVVGYEICDVDNDGLPELVVASISGTEKSYFIGSLLSQIVVYDLK
ncbi:MAG: FG-GAP-like repeat-containing protein [Thermodesulfobacteriota bacterium]|nr:FG-GAP-like repeat-containing protein [Thermodesulfobacteriota bacterium]